MAINFRGRADVKYFMQTQHLRFYEDAAKVSSLPLLEEEHTEAAVQRCSREKMFWKYATNLQENVYSLVWFQ